MLYFNTQKTSMKLQRRTHRRFLVNFHGFFVLANIDSRDFDLWRMKLIMYSNNLRAYWSTLVYVYPQKKSKGHCITLLPNIDTRYVLGQVSLVV